ILLSIFLFLTSGIVNAQDRDTIKVRIETKEGNEYIGAIIGEDSLKIELLTLNLGKISIFKSDITKKEEIINAQFKNGQYWFENPQATRYFWSPNGYGLKPGEGYFQNIWILWNQFAVGLTENFSLGAGIIPLFLFEGAPTPVFFTPKISIPIEKGKVNIGAGALLGTVIGESNTGFGIVYGLSTFGTRDNNTTIGLGYGFAGGEWASSPMINFNGMFRTGSRGYFITENYYIDGTFIIAIGGRWIIKKAALDFGLIIPAGSGASFAVPWLGFTIPFYKLD
ncbi:MAG: hypothetical protein JXR31_13640, partial [Prolixibacteraceae bacterium]|nr:hypothetical protein [Prolixibacteraceae bacterium]